MYIFYERRHSTIKTQNKNFIKYLILFLVWICEIWLLKTLIRAHCFDTTQDLLPRKRREIFQSLKLLIIFILLLSLLLSEIDV